MSDTNETPIEERKYRDDLALKWAEIEIRRKELVLKEEEAKTNRGKWLWMSPTQATLMIAVIGLAASAFGAGLTAFTQLKIEKKKEQNATELAQMENAQKLLSPDIDSNSMADLTRRLAIYIKLGLIPDPNSVLSTLTNDQLTASPTPAVAATSSAIGGRPQSPAIVRPNVSTDFGEDRPGGDYFSTAVAFLATCQQLCIADSKCKAYSYLPPGVSPAHWFGSPGPICWLKVHAYPETKYTGIISGIRTN